MWLFLEGPGQNLHGFIAAVWGKLGEMRTKRLQLHLIITRIIYLVVWGTEVVRVCWISSRIGVYLNVCGGRRGKWKRGFLIFPILAEKWHWLQLLHEIAIKVRCLVYLRAWNSHTASMVVAWGLVLVKYSEICPYFRSFCAQIGLRKVILGAVRGQDER